MTKGMARRGSNRRHSDGGRPARRGALAAAAGAIYTNTNSANSSSSSRALGADANTNVNANAERRRYSDGGCSQYNDNSNREYRAIADVSTATFPASREYPHILIASSPPRIRNK
ncbi:GL15764 [Drosophila persimilis]|uniref:GL15764 n=1 Tax=Drosophila persimilis TaxID=7234 RepID=B4HC87_DROPE|nr:GL15764 [Drosophila persimilis]